jgi:hypothetical protein
MTSTPTDQGPVIVAHLDDGHGHQACNGLPKELSIPVFYGETALLAWVRDPLGLEDDRPFVPMTRAVAEMFDPLDEMQP